MWRRIAAQIAAGDDDRTIAARLRTARAHVAHVRAHVLPPPPPEPEPAGDAPIVCAQCGLEGPPSTKIPGWCRACGISHVIAQAREVLAAQAPPPRPPAPIEERTCECGYVAQTPNGLAIHRSRKHPEEAPPAPRQDPLPPPRPARRLERDDRWTCECNGPHARSTRDPSRCIRCTGEYSSAVQRQRQGYVWSHQ